MNFLAHLQLSESNKNIIIGNFIADHIRGNKFSHYPPEIQQGIKLHREIDSYTDSHQTVRISKRRLDKKYGLYAGIIIDIFYDHFLAKNWHQYSAIPLDIYVNSIYQLLTDNLDILPEKTQDLLPFMIKYNWLYNYQYIEGIQDVLNGMNRRTKNKSKMNLAVEDLQMNYTELEQDFTSFFKNLSLFSANKLKELQTQA